MPSGLIEKIAHQFRGPVGNLRLIIKTGRALDKNFEAQDLFDGIERAQSGFDSGEGIDSAQTSGILSVNELDFLAYFSG